MGVWCLSRFPGWVSYGFAAVGVDMIYKELQFLCDLGFVVSEGGFCGRC